VQGPYEIIEEPPAAAVSGGADWVIKVNKSSFFLNS
jgi:hypothetical protein